MQEHNVKIFTQLLMEHDKDVSQKEQARKREMSKDARNKRNDLDKEAKLLDYLRPTRCDQGVAELPAGSMPGSSHDGEPPPPREKNPYEKVLDRIEDLLDDVLWIKEKCMTNTSETGASTLNIKEYHYRYTSAMAEINDKIPRPRTRVRV